MRRGNHLWLLCSLLLLVLGQSGNQSLAAIYKQVLPDGSIVFSDQKEVGATEIDVPPTQGYHAKPLHPGTQTDRVKRPQQSDKPYSKFRITAPEDDATIRKNAGNIEVNIELQPGLNQKAGHHIALTLDDRLIRSPSASTHILLKNLDRGTHKLQALVVDAQNNTLMRSPAITFHLFRFSHLLKPAQRP